MRTRSFPMSYRRYCVLLKKYATPPPQLTAASTVPLLFSMMLRVRGLVVPDAHGMWMAHMSQIARECSVPIVRVAPPDLERLVDGCRIDLDETRGIVTLIDACRA